MMIDDFEDAEEHVLDLRFLAKSKHSSALVIERPEWTQMDRAIQQVYTHGGFIFVRVLRPDNSYIREFRMESVPKQFRLMAFTRDENPRNELIVWCESETTRFRGTIRFGDDEWDARTVSSDLAVAQKIFNELYEHGTLSREMLPSFRSYLDPLPK